MVLNYTQLLTVFSNTIFVLIIFGLTKIFFEVIAQSSITVYTKGETFTGQAFILRGVWAVLYKIYFFLCVCWLGGMFVALNFAISTFLQYILIISLLLGAGVMFAETAYTGFAYRTIHWRGLKLYGNKAVLGACYFSFFGILSLLLSAFFSLAII